MKKIIIFFMTIFLLSSCITFNYNHVVEKFFEFDDIDFNNIKRINIISGNKDFSDAFRDYIFMFYKSRGLSNPNVYLSDKTRSDIPNELNIEVNFKDCNFESKWNLNNDNSLFYWKKIKANYNVIIVKTNNPESVFTMDSSNDFTIEEKVNLAKKNALSQRNLNINKIAEEHIKKIDDYLLYYGLSDKIFHGFFAKRLKPLSRELLTFKIGPDKNLLKAQKYLREKRLDEALIVWEQIYSDEDNNAYSRSVAAYNIGVIRAMEKDFQQAIIYFNRSEELEEESSRDMLRM
jgi:tetratricopeptide (TPR) repeat protein